jgi:predicted cupin superfamily sugar epimerase
MRITVITESSKEVYLLGRDTDRGERAMAVIPKGAIFAAENLDELGYTFVSCMTTPKFSYDGFRLIYEGELRAKYPNVPNDLLSLAYRDKLADT